MNSTMNQKNVDYLKDQLRYNGFGEALEADLKQKITEEPDKFQLTHETEFNGHKAVAVLDFNKSKESDMYFFNRYNLNVTPEDAKESLSQNFYINNKGQSITLKEAYNLMNGRSVHKELTNKEQQVYNAWVKLDFKDTDNAGNFKLKKMNENYGFDLEKVLANHPIMEMADKKEKERLIQSLERGNRQSVTFNLDGTEEKRFIEASPTAHALNIYDSQLKQIRQDNKPAEKQDIASEQTKKQNKRAKLTV
jgi:isochorismate synthase EntC